MPTVDCPSCGRSLRVAEHQRGTEYQCPCCGTTFPGAAPAALPIAPEPPEVLAEPPIRGLPPPPKPLRPVLVSTSFATEEASAVDRSEDAHPCPECGQPQAADTRRCSNCHAELYTATEVPLRRDYEPDRGNLISTLGMLSMWFGLPGLCGALFWPFAVASLVATGLATTALVMAQIDLEQMARNIMDPQGRSATIAGKGQAAVGLVLGLIGVLLGGVLRMLVFFAD